MQPRIYGPYPFLPITRRKQFAWPDGARLAVWVIPDLEFFHLDDVMPGANNERIAPAHAEVPNIRNWGCATTAIVSASGGCWRCCPGMASAPPRH